MIKAKIKFFAGVCALVLACALAGCSIFDMKDPEPPLAGSVNEDPLNIGDIINIARESAVSMDYRDYFASGAEFEYTLFRRIEGRENIINMLNRLRTQASLVEWQVEKAEKRFDGGMQIVEKVPYIVYSGGRQIGTGMADFRIIRDPEWVISYWKDVPDGGSAAFFEP